MLKSCHICGKIHNDDKMCRRIYNKKRYTTANQFRNSYQWKIKREQIKKRDLYLCQICLKDHKYSCDNLEIHHIVPLEEDYSKRLDSCNLISLCTYHHKEAEKGNIKKEILQRIVNEK